MVPPDGARATRLPTLSWDSVVDTPELDSAPPEPVAAPAPSESAVVFEPLLLAPAVESAPPPAPNLHHAEPAMVRTTPPAVIVPAIGDVISGPELVAPPAPSASVTAALPAIQEATPVEQRAPLLPSAPEYIPASRPAAPLPFEFDPGSAALAPRRQSGQRKKGRGLKLAAMLVVLVGLVAAGVVFGQPYLFPGDWDEATAPYAQAVETSRGVDFVEPLAVVAEPSAQFATRLQTQLAPVSPQELAQWRALGLINGVVDESTLAAQLTGWQAVVYSTTDGQVYHDLGVSGAELDPQLVEALTAASLDQEFGWSVEQPRRTLDAAAATSAEVLRQARVVQKSSTFATPIPSVPAEVAAALPAVIGYRTLAPHVFAEFDASIEPGGRSNPLADLGTDGPGILGRDAMVVATDPTMLEGDTASTPPVAKDRSFWFLVFGAYLDSRTAFAASEAVVESALTGATRGATQCVSATFSGSGVDQNETLRTALTSWAVAAPAEMASSFQVLPDGTLQLVSCDPGVGFVNAARADVARELLSWRVAELATMEAVRFGGGGEAELAEVWAFVQASPVAVDLMALPPTATPAEVATTARDAVTALFTPAG